jgi:hypothetical protein
MRGPLVILKCLSPVILIIYKRTEQTYAQYCCLFIYPFFFVHLLPDMSRQVTMPLSRGLYIKFHKMCMKYNVNTKC